MMIQHKLLDLYSAQYMSIPLKLLILKALDATICLPVGYHYFLNGKSDMTKAPYNRLVWSLLEKPVIFLWFGINYREKYVCFLFTR